jgi:hypothetical protein
MKSGAVAFHISSYTLSPFFSSASTPVSPATGTRRGAGIHGKQKEHSVKVSCAQRHRVCTSQFLLLSRYRAFSKSVKAHPSTTQNKKREARGGGKEAHYTTECEAVGLHNTYKSKKRSPATIDPSFPSASTNETFYYTYHSMVKSQAKNCSEVQIKLYIFGSPGWLLRPTTFLTQAERERESDGYAVRFPRAAGTLKTALPWTDLMSC